MVRQESKIRASHLKWWIRPATQGPEAKSLVCSWPTLWYAIFLSLCAFSVVPMGLFHSERQPITWSGLRSAVSPRLQVWQVDYADTHTMALAKRMSRWVYHWSRGQGAREWEAAPLVEASLPFSLSLRWHSHPTERLKHIAENWKYFLIWMAQSQSESHRCLIGEILTGFVKDCKVNSINFIMVDDQNMVQCGLNLL